MGAYAYVAPTTVEEALGVLKEHADAGKRAQPLAGGTDLLVQMRGIDKEPRTIVDIKNIAETNRLDLGGVTSQPFGYGCEVVSLDLTVLYILAPILRRESQEDRHDDQCAFGERCSESSALEHHSLPGLQRGHLTALRF